MTAIQPRSWFFLESDEVRAPRHFPLVAFEDVRDDLLPPNKQTNKQRARFLLELLLEDAFLEAQAN